jgi:DNA-binding MarR family transcriptional regulator
LSYGEDITETARSLRAALSKLNRRLRAQDDSAGVGSTGLSLLGRLLREGPSTAAALATRERLAPQSLTRTLKELEGQGMISRVADAADRRRSTITITPTGIEVVRITARSRVVWLSQTMSATLSATEREMLRIAVSLIERLADADE